MFHNSVQKAWTRCGNIIWDQNPVYFFHFFSSSTFLIPSPLYESITDNFPKCIKYRYWDSPFQGTPRYNVDAQRTNRYTTVDGMMFGYNKKKWFLYIHQFGCSLVVDRWICVVSPFIIEYSLWTNGCNGRVDCVCARIKSLGFTYGLTDN